MPRVLVFDSGVGGLSIVAEIRQKNPDIEIFFAADNAAFPYGIKEEGFLVQRIVEVVTAAQQYCMADLVVIACNTASTIALDILRSKLANPVVGVVPAIKPAAELSQSGKIGLLATPATVAGQYTQRLINEFARHCDVRLLGCARLVEMAEQKLRGQVPDLMEMSGVLKPLVEFAGMDHVVLACTHFPLLRDEIQMVFGPAVQCLDSGEAVARRVISLLDSHDQQGDDAVRVQVQELAKVLFTREDNLAQFFHCSPYWPNERHTIIAVDQMPVT